mmetsp:Transcript_85855/g.228193  ORF Transcript_85855/g.228193 Transcript_85855/m.228193 type:complete len:413 (-) Transcript_85855:18-1256(-)
MHDSKRSGVSGARVLITGATGLLGRQVFRVFEDRGWCNRGLGLARAKGRIVRCDLLNADDLQAQFDDFKPTIVVHCAAERRPDVLEENRAYATKINVDLTRDISKLCRARGVWMIYISTNYVFDGKEAPYAEDALAKPVNTYGESKYSGEQVVAEFHADAATVRVPLLYGPVEYLGETSVTALLPAIQKDSPKLDNWQERFPTCTEDTARVLEAFCAAQVSRGRLNPELFRGIFHWQANERHTKYTMATVIAEIAGIDTAGFVRIDDAPAPGQAPRPQFERMTCGRIEKLLADAGETDMDRFRSPFTQSLTRHVEPFVEKRQCECSTRRGRNIAIACGLSIFGLFLIFYCQFLWRQRSYSSKDVGILVGLVIILLLGALVIYPRQRARASHKKEPLLSRRALKKTPPSPTSP